MTASDDEGTGVVVNLIKARNRWAWMSRILGQEGADHWNLGNFYEVVVKSTLLFGAESWVMPPWNRRTLGGFHHRVAHQLETMQPKRTGVGMWIYQPLDEAMKAVGLKEVETVGIYCTLITN